MNQWILLRRLRAPAYLVLLGIMAMLAEWHILGLHRSWPLLLILAGVLNLAERAALSRVDPGDLNAGMYGGYGGTPPQVPPAGHSDGAGSAGAGGEAAMNSTIAVTHEPSSGTLSGQGPLESSSFEQGRS